MRSMAFSLKTGLPISVAQVLGPEWRGGAVVQLDDTLTRPGSEDLVLNHCWVKPFVQRFRDRVPSSFFITDVFLMLDNCFVRLKKGTPNKVWLATKPRKSSF